MAGAWAQVWLALARKSMIGMEHHQAIQAVPSTVGRVEILSLTWWRRWLRSRLVDLGGLAVEGPAAYYHVVVPGEGVHSSSVEVASFSVA